MASYLSSYFGSGQASGSGNQQPYQYNQPQRASYGQPQSQYNQTRPQVQSQSTWTGTFSTRIAGLRKALTRDSEEDDPDNEDASHVSNVLRAYYTEKGRTFPEWLPPDPYKPVIQTSAQQYGQYGGLSTGHGTSHNRNSSGAGLSDLWESGPTRPTPQAQSLRTPRPQAQTSNSYFSRESQPQPSSSRPLLSSQRSGNYQQSAQQSPAQPTISSRDRLRGRLQASGRNSHMDS